MYRGLIVLDKDRVEGARASVARVLELEKENAALRASERELQEKAMGFRGRLKESEELVRVTTDHLDDYRGALAFHSADKRKSVRSEGIPSTGGYFEPLRPLTPNSESQEQSAPIFDARTMESITPIFGSPSGKKRGVSEGERETAQSEESGAGSARDDESMSAQGSLTRAAAKESRVAKELAKLSSANGINVDDFESARKKRYEAEREAVEARAILHAQRSALWDSEQSCALRNRLKHTELCEKDVETREKMYRSILLKKKEEGLEKYLAYLNNEFPNEYPKLDMQWVNVQAKAILMETRDDKKGSEPRVTKRSVEPRKRDRAPGKKKIPKDVTSSEREHEDRVPDLISDSESGDGDDSEKRLAHVALATGSVRFAADGRKEGREFGSELTIHDHLVVTLDNGASSHVFRDAELLHSIKRIKRGSVTVGGLKTGSDGVECTNQGMFLSAGRVLYGPDSIANLLSQGTLVDQGHHVLYDTTKDIFVVKFKGTGVSLEFKRQLSAERATMMKHYVCRIDRDVHRRETALVETVKDRQANYTKVQVREAAMARDQAARLNYVTPTAHLDIIKQGLIENNSVTAEALARSVEIWGRPTERSKGNNEYKKPEAAARRLNALPIQAIRDNVAHADLLFVKGIACMIIVLDPMKYVWIEKLLSRATDDIRRTIDKFFADMKSYKVNITCLRCDGEGGIWALESEIKIRGTQMDKAAAGKHVELAERKIRQVKEGVRRAVASVPYMLCRLLLVACVYHSARCINLQRTKSQVEAGLPAPYNQLTHQKIDARIHMTMPFGTYVECTVRQTDSTTEQRSESAIYCSSALQSTEANEVYLIKSNAMALRGALERKTANESLIAILDRRAVREWGDKAKEIYFDDAGDWGDAEGDVNEGPDISETNQTDGDAWPETGGERRITRSMTAEVEGLDAYELNEAVGGARTRIARRDDDTEGDNQQQRETDGGAMNDSDRPYNLEGREEQKIGVLTPAKRREEGDSDKNKFNSEEFWQRHGKAVSPRYFGAWQEASSHLDMGASPSRSLAERVEPEYTESRSNGVATPVSERYEVLLMRELLMRKDWYHKEYALVMSQKQAIKKLGEEMALPAIAKELQQMIDKHVWEPVSWFKLWPRL